MMNMRRISKLVLSCGAAFMLAATPSLCHCGEQITADGTKITATTDRYRVVIDGLMITEIENKLTGEVYAKPSPKGEAGASVSPSYAQFEKQLGVSVRRLSDSLEHAQSINDAAAAADAVAQQDPTKANGGKIKAEAVNKDDAAKAKGKPGKGLPSYVCLPTQESKVSKESIPGGLRITYAGLKSAVENEADMTLAIDYTIDSATGDLCIKPVVDGKIPAIQGCQDRGVAACALQARGLDGKLDLVLPIDNGCHFNTSNAGANMASKGLYSAFWPQSWQAAIFIANSEKGCMAVWADEAEMNYSRGLDISRNGENWNAGFSFNTIDLIWRSNVIKDATWRFNVWNGYWARAAEHYRAQCERQWPEMQPLEKRKPEWASKVRVQMWGFYDHTRVDEIVKRLLPPGAQTFIFHPQDWLVGWNDHTTADIYGACDGIFPNYPQRNPTHYEGLPGIVEKDFAILEKAGIHVFPYTNTCLVLGNHPWKRDKLGNRSDFSWQMWGRFYAEFIDDITKRYGVTGIYEDCSWVGAGSPDIYGVPDNMSGFKGKAEMGKYFQKLQPNIATMGERRQEDTARHQAFALQVTGWNPDMAHPINACLQEPYCRVYNFSASSATADVDDIQGNLITKWDSTLYSSNHPMQDDRMRLIRGQVFTKEQLLNYFPEKWDSAVAHYFKGQDGTEFRFIKDNGMKFVKCLPAGEEIIYWRMRGMASTAAKGAGIEGWLGYDGDRIVGLNPRATYCVFNDIPRPEVTLCGVPEGYAIKRCVPREGFWVVELDTIEHLAKGVPPNGAPTYKPKRSPQTVRVRSSGKKVKFTGVLEAKELANNEYELKVNLPGGFGAYWTEPVSLSNGQGLFSLPHINSTLRRDTGLIVNLDGGDGEAGKNEEGSSLWLVSLPIDCAWLTFAYGGGNLFSDGGNYMARVNGNEIWKRYQSAIAGVDREGKQMLKKGKIGAVSLSDYQDTTVILELVINGNESDVSDSLRISEAKITADEDPPKGAEFDGEAKTSDSALESDSGLE